MSESERVREKNIFFFFFIYLGIFFIFNIIFYHDIIFCIYRDLAAWSEILPIINFSKAWKVVCAVIVLYHD